MAQFHPDPSNPAVVKFIDYFVSADLKRKDSDVMADYPAKETGIRELERKRRIGEVTATLYGFYDDIKHLMVSNVKIIPAPDPSTSAKWHFKSCSPISLCILVRHELAPGSAVSSPKRDVSHSPIRFNATPNITSIFVNFNLGASYPGATQPQSDTSVEISHAIGICDGKVALLKRVIREYVRANLGQELIYGVIWEVKHYLSLLVTIPEDHNILSVPESVGFEMLLQLSGLDRTGPSSGGLYAALQLKQQKVQTEANKGKKKDREDYESDNAAPNSHTIRMAPIKLGDLISGKVLTDERGRALLHTLTTLSFTRRGTAHHNDDLPNYLTLALTFPRAQTFRYTMAKYKFILHRTDYVAYHSDSGRRFRVSTFKYDLSPIVRSDGQFWPTLAKHIEARLETFFSDEAISRFIKLTSGTSSVAEQLSTYEHFALTFNGAVADQSDDGPKHDLSLITFTLVREGFPLEEDLSSTVSSDSASLSTDSKYVNSLASLKRTNALCSSMRLGMDRKQMYTSKLLTALFHLQKSHYFQGEFLPEKIYFAQDGSVKIFDSYLDTLVQVLIPFVFENEVEVTKTGALKISELANLGDLLVKSMCSNDVFNFGSFVLALVTDFHFDPIMTVATGNLDLNINRLSQMLLRRLEAQVTKESLRDFIELCINPDEYQRVDFRMLLHHSFVLEWNARMVREIASQPVNNANPDEEEPDHNRYAMALLANDQGSTPEHDSQNDNATAETNGMFKELQGQTRSNLDFRPMICYGKGGFGHVYKVRNKLDDSYYALKRVYIKEEEMEKLRREVQHLSRLAHQNVVRYFAAWTEWYNGEWQYLVKEHHSGSNMTTLDESSFSEEDTESAMSEEHTVRDDSKPVYKEDSEVDDSLVCFGDPTKPADQQEQSGYDTSSEASDTEDDESSGTSEESSRHSDSSVNQSNGPDGQQVATSPAHTNKSRPSPPKSRKSPEKVSTFPCYCLCIQMELCEKQTLHDMIATQTIHKDPELKIRISAEILAGLDYIHKQGIIHRDLKPRNIFFDKNNRVKIGDFGLALAVSKTDSNESLSQEGTLKSANESYSQLEMLRSGSISSLKTSPTDRGSRHSVGIGTLPYMAPEIYYDAHYTNLVDMFSFGVILFEMAYPMNTQSERIRVLEQLKPKKSSTMVAAVYKDSLVGFKPSLPTDVDKYIKPNEKKLIERLLDVLPANRPSASTLLKSGEFGPAGPAKKASTAGIETKSPRNDIYESQKQLLQSAIKNPSPQQAFLLECLFARTQPMLESIAYDIDVSSESTDEFYNSIYQFNLVSRWFEAQSRQYGALHLQSVPFLMPKTSLYQSANVSTESCQLLDSEGMLVTLPYNLRTQLARYLALSGNSINFLCRSTMDRVFRREHAGPYHPRELWTASFDLIWPQEYSRATVVPYADLLCFTTQILSFFLPLSTESTPSVMGSNTSSTFANANTLVFHITNIPIFQAICDYLKINRQDYQLIIRLLAENMEAIVRNGFTPFRPILKMQLVKQAESEASFESLCELLTISSTTPTDLVAQIRAILCKSHKTQSVNGFLRNKVDQHITEMSTLHRLWGATQYPIPSSAIAFRFGLSCVSKTSFFYNHILIHAILEGQRLNVVAIGGRYDMMINGYKTLYQQAEEDVSMNEKCKSTGDTLPVMMSELWPSAKQDDDGLSRKEPTAATYQPRPFQPKFALGISFSVEKLCHFFGQSTESQLPGTCDFQAKFAKLFPFAQSPLGDVSPSLIDLIIAPSAPVPAVCRLAQLFRSRGLRLTILPELGAKELAEPMISKMEETDATIEMINSYAANVQVKLVLVIDQTELAKPRFGSSETHYTVREFSYAMTSDGKCLSVPEVMAPSQYLLGKGRWNKHYFATTEENAVNYVLGCTRRHERARNPSGVDSSANSSFANGSPPDMFGNLPESLQLKSGFAGESSGVGRTMRSCSFSVGSAGGGGGGGGNQTAHITSPSSFHYPLMSTGSAPSSGFTSSSSGSSSAIDLDFISANKRSDRQRMTNSINNFFNKTLPALNTSLVRVLAVDLPFSVIKAVADIVESDLVADFMVPGGIPQPDSVFSFGGCGYDNSTLESFKGKFISLFNDLKARNKRDFADNIDKLAEELWRSIRKKLLTQEQNVGHTGAGQRSQPTVSMIVLIAYRDSQFKHRLVSL